jgi:hypothetical protein
VDESILETIKRMLGLDEMYDVFDQELLVHINTALFTLRQLGVGPDEGFDVESASETWSDFLGEKKTLLKAAKDFIFLSVKQLFDPSGSGTINSMQTDKLKELTYRLLLEAEAGDG